MGRPWTRRDEQYLIFFWGEKAPAEIAETLERTIVACERKITKLTGSRSRLAGTMSQSHLAERLGYTDKQIRRAVDSLGILEEVRQPGPGMFKRRQNPDYWDNRPWAVTEDQSKRIFNWLWKHIDMKWSRKGHLYCLCCETREHPHKGHGLCRKCHSRIYGRQWQTKNRAKVNAAKRQ